MDATKPLLKKMNQIPSPINPLVALSKINQLGVLAENKEQLHNFELLFQWRERYASITDEEPEKIASTKAIVLIAQSDPEKLDNVLKANVPFKILKDQQATIYRILREQDLFFNRVNNTECHNCLIVGHVAVHCPFLTRAVDRVKKYMQLHPEHKTAQNRRRRQNKQKNKLERQKEN